MKPKPSPRTVRYRRRKQTIRERMADLPPTLLVEDSRILIQRSTENFPHASYFQEVPSTTATRRIDTSVLHELEQQYQVNTVNDNAGNFIDVEEIEVPLVTAENSSDFERTSVTPVMTGAAENSPGKINPVCTKIAALASRHGISNQCVDDILDFTREVSMFYRDCIPRNSKTVEQELCQPSMDVEFLWNCNKCGKLLKEKLFDTPFSSSCCQTQVSHKSDQYVLFNPKEILELLLPIVYSHINLIKLLRFKPLLAKTRHNLGFTDKDISVTINVDGVALTNGSKCGIYPILGFIDGTSSRCSDQNILLFGFWIGPEGGKPNVDVLLGKLVNSFVQLEKEGFTWKKLDGESVTTRVLISSCLCDSVARPMVQGINQWNSEYGCPYCLHQESGHYFTPNGKCLGLRTGSEYRSICDYIQQKKNIQTFGIRYPTPLLQLSYFDPILGKIHLKPFCEAYASKLTVMTVRFESYKIFTYFHILSDFAGFPPCIMHAGYLGVCKSLTEALIQSRQSDRFYVSASQMNEIDNYLRNIKPPYRVSRVPRSLKFLAWYKAHELCMWLLYYSPAILHTILEENYFEHWLLLVRGLSLLLRDEITTADLDKSSSCLVEFARITYELYGKTCCFFNVHLMTHLPYLAQHLGPLYFYSMAPFESFNMKIRSYITSSQHIGSQIAKRYIRDRKVKLSSPEDSGTNQTTDFSMHAWRKGKHDWYICPNDNCKVRYYGRVTGKSGRKFYSLTNTKTKIRNSCCFVFNNEQIMEVEYYARVTCTGDIFAVGSVYTVEPAFKLIHYFKSTSEAQLSCPIKMLKEIVTKIAWKSVVYFIKFLNDIECHTE